MWVRRNNTSYVLPRQHMCERRILEPTSWSHPYFLPDIIMSLQNAHPLAKIARYTLESGVSGDAQGTLSKRAVAEYQAPTSPRVRVRHFNIAGVAWSNFKPGINNNERTAILNDSLSIDVMNVGAGVDEAVVVL